MQFQSTKNLKKIFHTNLEKISGDTAFTSELDYYHQNKNARVTTRVGKQRKTWDLRKFQENP